MRRLLLFGAVFLLTIPGVLAQGKTALSTSWTCATVEPVHTIAVPGQADHAYSLYQVKCTATKGEIAGVKQKEGIATEFGEAMGSAGKSHGIFVETLASGDTATYDFQSTSTMKNKIVESASNTWTITSGTGKLKGIKGSGSCKGKGNADGSLRLDCTGRYAMPK